MLQQVFGIQFITKTTPVIHFSKENWINSIKKGYKCPLLALPVKNLDVSVSQCIVGDYSYYHDYKNITKKFKKSYF